VSDPITEAEKLLAEAREPRAPAVKVAWAVDNTRRIADGFEDLLQYIKGYRTASVQEQQRLVLLVSNLLAAIAPLFAAPSASPFGRPSEHLAWLTGTAPRLRRAFTDASEYLEEERAR
jgi:hypothetical protein